MRYFTFNIAGTTKLKTLFFVLSCFVFFNSATAADVYPSGITGFTGGGTYCQNAAAANLSVTISTTTCGSGKTANISRTFTWYSNTVNSTSGGTVVLTDGPNANTSSTYTPPTTTVGTLYYYCIITWNAGACAPAGSLTTTTQTVVVNASPTASAGSNQTLAACSTGTTLAANTPATGETGTWTVVSGTATVTTPSSPTSTVTGLTIGTTATLRWTVTITATGCSTSSDMTITTTQGPGCWNYCTSNASSTSYSYISNVTFNTINNSSSGCAAYTDYTGISTVVNPGSTYNLTITKINDCTGTTQYTGRFAAWIDWNNDGDFADAGEQVLSDAAASNGPITASVTVPAGATIGTTRMRCIFREGTTVPPVCGAYSSWGETEDYSITIAPLVDCSGTPAAGTITPATSNITTAQSVTLTWSEMPQTGLTYQWQTSSSTSGPWSDISGATDYSYTASGLSGGTHYFRLIITCTFSGLSATSATAQVNVTVVYCTPAATNCTPNFVGGCGTQYLVITNVTLETLNNNSSATSCDTDGYSDFTALAAPALNIGQSYNLSVSVGATTCGTNTAMAWFDFNQNGDFGDAGEAFYLGTMASNSTVTISITVPTTASIGNTRMRIKYLYNAQILSSWSCYTNSVYGETEDYTVNLQCTPTPSDVSGKYPADGVSLACGSAAILGWDSHTCATGFKVYLGTANPPTTLVSTQSTTNYYTGNLASNTTYYWKVVPYSSNGDGASSTWSFVTNTAINTAISQDESGCTDGGLTLTASGGTFPDYFWYDVPYGGIPIETGTTYTPTGLTQPTTYYVSNVLTGPDASIDASAAGGVVCSNTERGWGNMLDIQAKTANLTITGISVMFRSLGTGGSSNRPVKVYYRQSSYQGNAGSSSGWILLDDITVSVPNTPTAPTYINSTDFFIPAGMTFAMYVVYDQEYAASPGLFANSDLEMSTGTSICGSEFGTVINDRTFRGTLFYKTSCSSPTIPVVATPWVSTANVTLAASTISGLTERCTESGWTYYADPAAPDDWLFAINKNTNTFTATVDLVESPSVYTSINATDEHGSFLLSRYWNVNMTSGTIDPALPVSVRFFVDTAEIRAAINARDLERSTNYPTTNATAWRWFKSVGANFDPAVGIDGNNFTFTNMTPTVVNNLNIAGAPYTGFINNVAYVQLGGITSFSGGTGGVGFTPFGGSVLPIELLSFDARYNGKTVDLNWNTASEINNDYFTVERTQDGENFNPVAKVKGAGNSNAVLNYATIDNNPVTGTSYYRLKQTDFDGKVSYSEMVAVNIAEVPNALTLAPNPANSNIEISFNFISDAVSVLNIFDRTGKLVYQQKVAPINGNNTVSIDISKFATGMYHAVLTNEAQVLKAKFIKE